MGKGDRKTAKGKRFNSSYGNIRTAGCATKATGAAAAPVAKKTSKTVAKAPAKKVAKKAVAKD
ncbi:30S ribosomal protein THX [Lysobacter sp. A3-1-A15]|uniref:30S ribosomal protein THX n=1 Tax=Novilysobacter viscosus TaxID=3098602 RepID=UPI002ED8CF26